MQFGSKAWRCHTALAGWALRCCTGCDWQECLQLEHDALGGQISEWLSVLFPWAYRAAFGTKGRSVCRCGTEALMLWGCAFAASAGVVGCQRCWPWWCSLSLSLSWPLQSVSPLLHVVAICPVETGGTLCRKCPHLRVLWPSLTPMGCFQQAVARPAAGAAALCVAVGSWTCSGTEDRISWHVLFRNWEPLPPSASGVTGRDGLVYPSVGSPC